MHHMFASETPTDNGDIELQESTMGLMQMIYGEKEGGRTEIHFPETEMVHDDSVKDQKLELPTKKRSRVSKEKAKSKKKRGAKSKSNSLEPAESFDEDEGNKRGPNWKEHWIVNLIHLRGTMHNNFSGMKKQGVDNWGALHTHLVAACPDFDRSVDACRKKWKRMYDTYKANYTANGISGNARSTNSKYYSLIDGYMHERANVLKHVHGSANDEDLNNTQGEGEEDFQDSIRIPESTASTSQLSGKKKTQKLITEQAIAVMAEQAVKLTDVVKDSEAAKLNLLQGMLAMMNELVKKL